MTSDRVSEVVVILLYDYDMRVLLQKRTNDAPYMPNQWAFFGGSVEAEESILEAVRRESVEELNYNPVNLQHFIGGSFAREDHIVQIHAFYEQFQGDKTKLQLLEGQDWGWFLQSETVNLNLLPRDLAIVNALFNAINSETQ